MCQLILFILKPIQLFEYDIWSLQNPINYERFVSLFECPFKLCKNAEKKYVYAIIILPFTPEDI